MVMRTGAVNLSFVLPTPSLRIHFSTVNERVNAA